MATIPTVTIQTGPDTFITVNQSDYESFKAMEYTPKLTKKQEAKLEETKPEETQDPEIVVTKKRSSYHGE